MKSSKVVVFFVFVLFFLLQKWVLFLLRGKGGLRLPFQVNAQLIALNSDKKLEHLMEEKCTGCGPCSMIMKVF